MVKSHSRGWDILFSAVGWKYADTNESLIKERPCKRCGKMPTKEGYDACIGYKKGYSSACCGHGAEQSYYVKEGEV